jgi:hypothetical protein
MADLAAPNLLPIIVGGAIALAGTIVGQVFSLISGYIQRRNDRDVRQRERLERLAEAVGAALTWYQRLGSCRSIDDICAAPPPPEARRAAVLAHLYFPALAELTAEFANSLVRYHHHATDCYQPGVPASVGAQMVMIAKDHPEAKQIQEESFHLRLALDQAITKEAKKYSHV